ncbi:MAG: YdcF family protein [Bryobacteraceae bacterium]
MLRKLALSLAAVAIILYLAREPLLGALGSYLVQASPPVQADIALVLAGDGRGGRILKGAQLVRDGFVPKVLVSGPDGNYALHECDLAIPFAVKAGYPESYFIHFENNARNTRDEARQAAAVLRKMGAHRVLLVTTDFHTRRAARMFRSEAPDLQITTVSAPDVYFSAHGWWHNREGQKTALYEWMKTIAAWVNL